MVGTQASLTQARYAVSHGICQRRACALIDVSHSGLYYTPSMPMKDEPAVQALRRLSGQYPRFGSRRICVFLGREGILAGKERCARLWREVSLRVPGKRKRRKTVASSRPRPCLPTGRNSVWCYGYNFVLDACANGQTLKCLTVVDEYTRECLAIDMADSIWAQRVIEVLSRLVSLHGAPCYLRSDNGPEFVSTQLLQWAVDENLETVLIEPGKPWQRGTNESFNGKFRDECLSMQWFRNRLEARVIIEAWRRHNNDIRPHSSLNYLTPRQFVGNLSNDLTTMASGSNSSW